MLVLVRHGETAANAEGLLLGRADVALSERGQAQARAAADSVRSTGEVALVISSPLTRARDSASCFGLPVEVDERWVEVDYGEYDLQPLTGLPSEVWQRWRADPAFTPAGGESLADCGRRVRAACEELAERAVDEPGDVVVVSHVSPIKAAAAWAVGAGDDAAWRMHLGVASITRIGIALGMPVLRSFNERAHVVD